MSAVFETTLKLQKIVKRDRVVQSAYFVPENSSGSAEGYKQEQGKGENEGEVGVDKDKKIKGRAVP